MDTWQWALPKCDIHSTEHKPNRCAKLSLRKFAHKNINTLFHDRVQDIGNNHYRRHSRADGIVHIIILFLYDIWHRRAMTQIGRALRHQPRRRREGGQPLQHWRAQQSQHSHSMVGDLLNIRVTDNNTGHQYDFRRTDTLIGSKPAGANTNGQQWQWALA